MTTCLLVISYGAMVIPSKRLTKICRIVGEQITFNVRISLLKLLFISLYVIMDYI